MPQAFFVPTDEKNSYLATSHAAGPWSPQLQHAGPPSALLVRAIETVPTTVDGLAQVARVTIEILGPVPVGEVSVNAEIARPGRTVELVEAALTAGGRVAMRARAWRLRAAPQPLPPFDNSAALVGFAPIEVALPPIPPESSSMMDSRWPTGYLHAVDWRFVTGHMMASGPSAVWARPRIGLVDGEPITNLQRLFVLADSGNGLSGVLDMRAWWYINTELTVHLVRPPASEWILVSARSQLGGDGIGLAETELFDTAGRIGRGAQSLMVGPR